jgi:hypothetical protein
LKTDEWRNERKEKWRNGAINNEEMKEKKNS